MVFKRSASPPASRASAIAPGFIETPEGLEDVAGMFEDGRARGVATMGEGEFNPRQGLLMVSRSVERPRIGVFEVPVAGRQGHHLSSKFHRALRLDAPHGEVVGVIVQGQDVRGVGLEGLLEPLVRLGVVAPVMGNLGQRRQDVGFEFGPVHDEVAGHLELALGAPVIAILELGQASEVGENGQVGNSRQPAP